MTGATLRRTLGTRLAQIVGKDHVRNDTAALIAHATDATALHSGRPDAVVHPADSDEVAAILRLAGELDVPVVPRGAGTNLSAGTVPDRGGIVLVMTRMNRLLELAPPELLAVCQPGLTCARLAEAAAGVGLLYPPDPGSRTTATLGGNVAECAGGLRGLKYGVTRDYVLGAEAVLASGEKIRCGGRLVKNVAGYDLVRLLCGSEGTLAVITELTLRLVPAPASVQVGIAYFEDLVAAGNAVTRTLAAGVVPATLEFLDRTCMRTVESFAHVGLRTDVGAALIFGQDGDAEAVRRDVLAIAEACREERAVEVVVAQDPTHGERILEARRAALPSLARLGRTLILEDATVPRARIAEMVSRIDQAAERYGLLIGTFGHAGDGNLHPTIVIDDRDADEVRRAHLAFDDIFSAAIELGGSITGEHGVGLAKLKWLEAGIGAAQVDLLRRIKHAFDPQGILNPGKLGS